MFLTMRKLRRFPIVLYRLLRIGYLRFRGVEIGKNVWISPGAKIDTAGGRIVICDDSGMAHGSVILSHDMMIAYTRPGSKLYGRTFIGRNVHIGVNAVILPNVSIGDNTIIGAGVVVAKDVPANSIVVPAVPRVMKDYQRTFLKKGPATPRPEGSAL